MKPLAVILLLLGASGTVLAEQVPQNSPQARAKQGPSNAQPAKPTLEAKPAQDTKPAQEAQHTSANSACSMMLREIAAFTPLPDSAGPGECGVTDRVQLDAVKMPDGSRVSLSPPATLRCAMAESIAEWVRSDLGKAAKEHGGSALKALVLGGSYDCRPRNGVKGAKISEHGHGNAIDVAALKLGNRISIDPTQPIVSKELREKMRASACSRFTTVLGPGSDAYHANHIHVDLAVRSRGHRMCQWEVREEESVVASAKPAIAIPVAARRLAAAKDKAANAPTTVQQAAVPLPLRRPFELVFAMRK